MRQNRRDARFGGRQRDILDRRATSPTTSKNDENFQSCGVQGYVSALPCPCGILGAEFILFIWYVMDRFV